MTRPTPAFLKRLQLALELLVLVLKLADGVFIGLHSFIFNFCDLVLVVGILGILSLVFSWFI